MHEFGRQIFKKITLIFLLVFLILHACYLPLDCKDDSFISFRHSWNFLQGNGLVFNPGERVEGFSNPIWTALMVIPIHLGLDPEQASFWMGLFFLLLGVYFLFLLGEELNLPFFISGFSVLLCMFNTGYIASSTNGLETGMYSAGIMLVVVLFQKAQTKFLFLLTGIVSGVLFWVRFEGILIGLCIIAGYLMNHSLTEKENSHPFWDKFLYLLIGWIAPVLILEFLRYLYYGEFLPNSVRAKSGALALILQGNVPRLFDLFLSSIRDYIAPYLVENALVFLFLPVGLTHPAFRKIASTSILIIFALFGVALLNGGDWMRDFRLLNPVFPMFAILGVTGLFRFFEQIPVPAILGKKLGTSIALVIIVTMIFQGFDSGFSGKVNLVRRQPIEKHLVLGTLGQKINQFGGSDRVSILTEMLGRVSYYAPRLYVWDLYGLTDPYLANNGFWVPKMGRRNLKYSLEKKPVVVISNWFPTCVKMMEQQAFNEEYVYFNMSEFSKDSLYVFVRRDYVNPVGDAIRSDFSFQILNPPDAIKVIALNHIVKFGITEKDIHIHSDLFKEMGLLSKDTMTKDNFPR